MDYRVRLTFVGFSAYDEEEAEALSVVRGDVDPAGPEDNGRSDVVRYWITLLDRKLYSGEPRDYLRGWSTLPKTTPAQMNLC